MNYELGPVTFVNDMNSTLIALQITTQVRLHCEVIFFNKHPLFLTLSFVPFQLHPIVARECIAHRVNMVTASYVSPALRVSSVSPFGGRRGRGRAHLTSSTTL